MANRKKAKSGTVTKKQRKVGTKKNAITKDVLESILPQSVAVLEPKDERNSTIAEREAVTQDAASTSQQWNEPKTTVSTVTSTDKDTCPWPDSEILAPIDTFFSFMLSSVKRLSPEDQYVVKNRIFALVNEMEGKYLDMNRLYEMA
ncbi:uncharacterized protein [Rhodnius prolixus]|uniref:Uncharacterized protein n=1 Tax=Rhodnius prolixus TaxID=13249 RepID=T1IBI3_RHOPR